MLFGIPESGSPNLLVLGVAWDGSSSYRRGAAAAPRAIRRATSERLYNRFTEDLVDLASVWRYRDLGDVTASSYSEVLSRVEGLLSRVWSGELLLVLGGDHSITYAVLRALGPLVGRRFGLLYFDAHPDLYPEYEGDPYSHACTLRRILEDGIVRGEDVVVVGVRAPTPEQLEYAESTGVTIVTASQIHRGSRVELPDLPLYISYDIDALDPAYAPAVGNPEPGGLSTRDIVEIIKDIRDEVIGFDIVEMIPSLDAAGITAYAAAKLVRETLGAAARGRRASLV